MNTKLWYNFLFTPGLNFVDERFFLRLGIKCRELAKAGLTERPRVLIDTRVADLSKGLPGTMLGGILTIAQQTPALDYFWVIPNAGAWQAAIDKQYADAQASGDLEEQQAFADVDPGKRPLLNLFLCLNLDLNGDVREQVDSLRAIPGVRRALVINPITGWLSDKFVGPESTYTGIPGDIDWVITFGGDLNEAHLVGRMCNTSRVPHFHAGFTDIQGSPWEAQAFMARNELPRTVGL